MDFGKFECRNIYLGFGEDFRDNLFAQMCEEDIPALLSKNGLDKRYSLSTQIVTSDEDIENMQLSYGYKSAKTVLSYVHYPLTDVCGVKVYSNPLDTKSRLLTSKVHKFIKEIVR